MAQRDMEERGVGKVGREVKSVMVTTAKKLSAYQVPRQLMSIEKR